MAGDKKTRSVEPERCLSVTRRGCDALVAEAYGKQATQGRRGVATTRNKKKQLHPIWMELLKKARSKRALSQRVAGRRRYASKPNPVPASASSANVLGSGTIVIVNEACGRASSLKF